MWAKQIGKLGVLTGIGVVFLAQTAYAGILTTPTHFVDSAWNLNDTGGYNSIEVDIKPEVEEVSSSDGYFFANTVYFRNYSGNNFGGAYAGMQSNGYNGSGFIGKMAIFSVWDVTSGIAEPAGGGAPFGGEGTGYSVRLPYAWKVGVTYRLKIYIDQDKSSGDRLWGASLTDLNSGIITRIGRVYVPVARGKIYGPVTFHEIYLTSADTCSAVKKSQVAFTNMAANDGAAKATSWNHYAIGQTPSCPQVAWLSDASGGYESGVNTPKPVVAPTPTTVVVPTPTATPKETTRITQPAPVVVPALTAPSVKTNTATHSATPVTATILPKKSAAAGKVLILTMLLLAATGGALLAIYKHINKRRFAKYLKKHFPFDPDTKGIL